MKESESVPVPAYESKLTDAEKDLLAKYFVATQENAWRPSLIAFPHFQAFPSPANEVLHSSRTGILIDTMQHLQGLTEVCLLALSGLIYIQLAIFCNYVSVTIFIQDDDISDPYLGVVEVEPHDNVIEGNDLAKE